MVEITPLKSNPNVIDEIHSPVKLYPVQLYRINKHRYALVLDKATFIFHSEPVTADGRPRGPGLRVIMIVAHTEAEISKICFDTERDPSQLVRFEAEVDEIHIERMNKHRYWCRIGEVSLEISRPDYLIGGVHLIKADKINQIPNHAPLVPQ